jgi:hypothetical protein
MEFIVSWIRNDNYLPPLNWTTHQHEQVQAPATAPTPPPPPRRSKRHASHTVTDGETSGYQSDNHFIDPSAGNYHLRHSRQLPSSRGQSIEPISNDTSSVIIHHSIKEQMNSDHLDGHQSGISARADYKFLERKKWVQDGTVPYDLYPEVGLIINNDVVRLSIKLEWVVLIDARSKPLIEFVIV